MSHEIGARQPLTWEEKDPGQLIEEDILDDRADMKTLEKIFAVIEDQLAAREALATNPPTRDSETLNSYKLTRLTKVLL